MPSKKYSKSNKVCGICNAYMLKRLSQYGTFLIYYCDTCDYEMTDNVETLF